MKKKRAVQFLLLLLIEQFMASKKTHEIVKTNKNKMDNERDDDDDINIEEEEDDAMNESLMLEIEMEIERAKTINEEEEEGETTTTTTTTTKSVTDLDHEFKIDDSNIKKEQEEEEERQARAEAVKFRKKKIEEKSFDPRAEFRERVKKKNESSCFDWQRPKVVLRRQKNEEKEEGGVIIEKSWNQLENEWKQFDEKCKAMNSNNNNAQDAVGVKKISFHEVPFPRSGAALVMFLTSKQGPFGNEFLENKENGKKKAKRELAKRWHPDKFAQKFANKIKDEDVLDVLEAVQDVYQSGTAFLNAL